MPDEELHTNRKVIGTKQVKRAVTEGNAYKVYLASDAEPHIAIPVKELCVYYGVDTDDKTYTRKELGAICDIEVKAATVALLRT